MSEDEIYRNYTSTSMLVNIDEDGMTKLCKAWFKTMLTRYLPIDKKATILDLGCGYGRYVMALNEMDYVNTQGIDISESQVCYARDKMRLSNIKKADALEFLKGKINEYDCILAFDILEHLAEDKLLDLAGLIFCSLKPGGTLIVRVPCAISPFVPNRHWDLTHKRAFTTHSMEQLLLNSGFRAMTHHETLPHLHGVASVVRRIAWAVFFRPFIKIFLLFMHGQTFGGIYTLDMLTVAKK